MSEPKTNFTNDKVNTLINNLSEIFLNSTKSTFGTYCHKAGKTRQTKLKDKPWFDLDCKFPRQKYRELKRKFHKYRKEINKQIFAESEKNYKRTLDKTQRKYRQNLCRRLKNMRTKDRKEFWKILNQGKLKTQPNISLQKLFEFFKNLNTTPSDDIGAELPNLNVEELYQLNYELNMRIEKEEILKGIKKLKNNKASGEDAIIHEYTCIKATSDSFIVVYAKLFNLIFESELFQKVG